MQAQMPGGPQPARKLPEHVAIIMDGNGRWAQQRGRSRAIGHRAGGNAARAAIEFAQQAGISHLTLFAFSSENWNRPQREVDLLMRLFMRTFRLELNNLIARNIRIHFIGQRSDFSPAIQASMHKAEALSCACNGLQLHVALSYGGRWDITQALQQLCKQVASGELSAQAIDEPRLSAALSMAGRPDPELLIRTGGEARISNFLLWQLAYTELYFTDILWPDFDAAAFQQALGWYAGRQRRFGGVPGGET